MKSTTIFGLSLIITSSLSAGTEAYADSFKLFSENECHLIPGTHLYSCSFVQPQAKEAAAPVGKENLYIFTDDQIKKLMDGRKPTSAEIDQYKSLQP